MKETLTRVLTGAQERVRRGWVQGMAMDSTGTKVCAAQALGLEALAVSGVTEGSREHHHLVDAAAFWFMASAVDLTGGRPWGSIPNYNDFPGRTQEEVVECFDRALKLVERDLVA